MFNLFRLKGWQTVISRMTIFAWVRNKG